MKQYRKQLIGREKMASSCIRGSLDWRSGKISLLKEWNRLPMGVVESPSLEIFKMCRYCTLGHGLAGMVVLG